MIDQKKIPARVLLGALFFLALQAPTQGSTVAGKATVHQKPVAGVTVSAFPLSSLTLAGEAPHRSSPTGKDGLFALDLPSGDYYFLARGKGLFCFYGRNPVSVPAEGIGGMNLLLVKDAPPLPSVKTLVTTGILGQTTLDGAPMAGAIVTIYPDLSTRLKGVGLGMTAPASAQGIFEAELPPGTYYLLARQRRSDQPIGPLQAGDFIGYYPGNPLKVREGEVARVAIPMLEVPEKVERLAATLFGQTGIEGRVVDRRGKPLAGVRVFLYGDELMLSRPLYISQPTGEDGGFLLSFPEGGTYYLAARDSMGGPPQPGGLYGSYEGSRDHSLRVKTGERRKGIRIVVGGVP